jgi:hypothetical protein
MQLIQRRLSPALLIAIAALFVALAGTAAAAIVINSPKQIGPAVIQGRHIQNETIPNVALKDPQLKLRVTRDGKINGLDGDGTVQRAPNTTAGVYDVTFDAEPLNGIAGTDTIVNENCAITATARSAANPPNTSLDSFPVMFNIRTIGPNTVRVTALDPDVPPGRLVDTAFDIMASC